MTWLVFGVSVLLVLAGAVSITFGAPIIQLERGWAEVISGSVAVSGGGVVFALGVVLMRLEALRDAVADAAPAGVPFAVRDVPLDALAALADAEATHSHAPAAPIAPPAPQPSPSVPEPEPLEPRMDEDGLDLTSDQGLWKRIKRPPERADFSPPGLRPITADGTSERSPHEAAPALSAAVDDPRPEQRTPVVTPAPRADIATPDPDPVRPAEDEAGQLGWLERSLFTGRAARQAADPVSEPVGRGTRVEPSLGSLIGEPAPERSPQVSPASPPTVGSGADARLDIPQVIPADEGPTVIGRYQAGVASYVMYSDGTIEVETEGGQSHRFGSMDELKAFIANQDKADA